MIAASLPLNDWQFWATTGLFLGALIWLFRGWLPILGKRHRKRKTQRRVNITVGGKTVR